MALTHTGRRGTKRPELLMITFGWVFRHVRDIVNDLERAIDLGMDHSKCPGCGKKMVVAECVPTAQKCSTRLFGRRGRGRGTWEVVTFLFRSRADG